MEAYEVCFPAAVLSWQQEANVFSSPWLGKHLQGFVCLLTFGYVYFAVFDMKIYIFGPVFVYDSDSTAGDFRRLGFRLGELGTEARHWIRVSFPHEAIQEAQEGEG